MDFDPTYDFLITQSKSDCFCSTASASYTINGTGALPTHTVSYIGSCQWSGTTTICGFNYIVQLNVCYTCQGGPGPDWVLTYYNILFPASNAWNSVYKKQGLDCNPSPMGLFMPQGSDFDAGLPCTPYASEQWPLTLTLS